MTRREETLEKLWGSQRWWFAEKDHGKGIVKIFRVKLTWLRLQKKLCELHGSGTEVV